MNWYISLYKNLPDELKEDCDKKRGLYIVKKWTKHTTSICPFNVGNFVNVIIRKDVNW